MDVDCGCVIGFFFGTEYKDLEDRVDALRASHLGMLKYVCRTIKFSKSHISNPSHPSHRIIKVYDSESYDYPVQIQESITQLSTTIGHGITNFAANNLKGTNIPAPAPVPASPTQHKTLPHAIGRAATNAATTLQSVNTTGEDKLTKAMGVYAGAWEKVGLGLSFFLFCAPCLSTFSLSLLFLFRFPLLVLSTMQRSVPLSSSHGNRRFRHPSRWL